MNDNINQTYAPLVELIETLVLFFAVSVHLVMSEVLRIQYAL